MESRNQHILETIASRDVRFVQLWFTDILGTPKAITITTADIEKALEEGLTFDGSAIEGFSRVQESDMLARPDPDTFRVLPWREGGETVARAVCDITRLDGSPFEGDPRYVLRRMLRTARDMGLTFYAAPEVEYFYLESADVSAPPVPLDAHSYFDLDVTGRGAQLRKSTVIALEDMGIPVEYNHHEDSPSQHEIDLRHTDALTMADTIMTLRIVAKQLAASHGVHATFMPKPFDDVQGSGMHTHVSLFEGDRNVFFDEDGESSLSTQARGFVAGLLTHAREMSAVTNQWVNSFKRLGNFEAPKYCAWARNNRSVIVNVPQTKRPVSTRIEFRSPDPAVNPYLGFALMLGAGLKGIAEGYNLPDVVEENLYEYTHQELLASDIHTLPATLSQAIDEMSHSEFMAEVLGEHVFEWFIRNKRDEWNAYERRVSQFELEQYLPRL